MRILVTGGAGFVGSTLALLVKRDDADVEVVALDNLRRRGSEPAYVLNSDLVGTMGSFDLVCEPLLPYADRLLTPATVSLVSIVLCDPIRNRMQPDSDLASSGART